ncbi:hypothetical protein BD779DRAFT_1504999 [Infundibulicybe gibba]|nr:hypothetical protein BD779DRAFT_1504999 [Infundibulicybe gibba]
MALSAADLQKRHQLEGAPDPFPSLVDSSSPARTKPTATSVDTSESAFPSLASASPLTSAPSNSSAWSATAGPRIKSVVNKAPVFTDSFTLSAIDLSNTGRDGKHGTLGEVMKQVMAKYKVKLEASANQKTRQTTFHIKAETQKELDKAKRSLLALLSPTITLVINAPVSTIASIIGPKGATLKQIRDQTSVRVDIPKRDTLPTNAGNGHANGLASGKVSPTQDDDDDEEATIPVTLSGPQPLAYEAQALLNQIISSKTSKSTQRVRDIPVHILPFIRAKRAYYQAAAEGAEISLALNSDAREVTVSGERTAVARVVETIRNNVEELRTGLTSLKISLPKRQHRLLAGKSIDEILAKSKCVVVVAKPEDSSDEVIVWGQAADLAPGLTAVMEQANSKYIHEFPLPGPVVLSRQLLTYFTRIQYARTLSAAHPDVSVFTPSLASADKAQSISIDLIGEKSSVDAVVRKVSELIGKLIGATKEVSVDWLVHRVITGKNAKKLKQFHEVHNVQVFFPEESAEKSSVLLVYDPLSPSASPSPDDKKKHLEDVEKEIIKMAKDAADVKSETVIVEKRWHDAVIGQGGTTLNAIIGEDTTLSIKVGAEASDSSTEDIILVRGASADVDRAVKEIQKIVENAKNDEIDNSYSTEFDIDKEYVGRIVGSQGSGINRLRDQLGVKVDVSDDNEEKEKEGKKKKIHQKSRVKITGRKENVEEAKKRILAQIERLADETSESGKYAIRLEEKYSVKITFPRHSGDNGEGKTREQLKSDEVLVKGGRKGVAGAKSELLDAVEFEKETNNILKFTVPNRSIPRILGKGGISINEIKDETGAQIDVEKAAETSGPLTNITVRGTKKAIAAAKAAILAISDQVTEEATATVVVESRFHRNLIGTGGQGLKEFINRCGGPTDPRLQAGLIRFPRQGEPSDEVRLRGEPKLVAILKAELEKVVATLRDRVVLAVEIPSEQHRALIGRGGQHLNELQSKLGVQVQFPGSRSYSQFGEPENAADFVEAAAPNIVKVSGPRSACEAAVEELKGQIKPPAPEAVTDSITVPLKYHHVISQQGSFLRNLRSFGVQENDTNSPEVQWEVAPNYQNAEEGDSTWTLKAKDDASLQRAKKQIQDAVSHAERMSHVGFLTLADRSMFPRIVGAKGANVARLRNETGADITVNRDDNTIVIIGAESDITAAKDAILRMVSNSSRGPRRHQE